MYERLVVGKYRLKRIYCSMPIVKELFNKIWKGSLWEDDNNRDNRAFLKLEKEIWREIFPHSAEILESEKEEE